MEEKQATVAALLPHLTDALRSTARNSRLPTLRRSYNFLASLLPMSAQIQDSQLANIWASALSKYKQDTKQDLLHVSLKVDSPKALLEIIDKEMKQFKEYRKKGERTRAVVISLLEMAASLSEMVSEGLTTVSTLTVIVGSTWLNCG